jgi:hypothetical protein
MKKIFNRDKKISTIWIYRKAPPAGKHFHCGIFKKNYPLSDKEAGKLIKKHCLFLQESPSALSQMCTENFPFSWGNSSR